MWVVALVAVAVATAQAEVVVVARAAEKVAVLAAALEAAGTAAARPVVERAACHSDRSESRRQSRPLASFSPTLTVPFLAPTVGSAIGRIRSTVLSGTPNYSGRATLGTTSHNGLALKVDLTVVLDWVAP